MSRRRPRGAALRWRALLLDRPIDLSPGIDKQTLTRTISGHMLGQAELSLIHERQP
jgi:hypothetical protein